MLALCSLSGISQAVGVNMYLSTYFIKGWKVVMGGVSKLILHAEYLVEVFV